MVSLKGHRVYLDVSTVIYALEGVPHYANLKAGMLIPLDNLEFTVVSSRLTLLEALIHPRRNNDQVAESIFRTFLTPSSHKIIEPISDAVLEKAIDLRAQHPSLKTPDAIHLATGILAHCDLFISGDLAWKKIGVTVVDPADVG